MAQTVSRPSLLDHLAHAALLRAMTAQNDASRPLLLVDATCGNGHDSLFLLRHAPENALLLCFDVQEAALAATRARLEAAGLAGQARLFLRGHEALGEVLAAIALETPERRLACVCFNLGWLPGGDKRLTTRAPQSGQALEAALTALAPQGVISLHCYTGHDGGQEEADSLTARAAQLPPRRWRVLHTVDANRAGQSESLLLLERLPVRHGAEQSPVPLEKNLNAANRQCQ
ncbi:MAG: class I SAM-dependent methyltransferase [Desulfovibrionaceae bacterium]|nr:class I SAM-dependent methyltransferase [Desulfovibrionaceae bacterium]